MLEEAIKRMIEAAKEAEKWILSVYEKDFDVEIKSDDSPVTEADKGADEIIRQYLSKLYPDFGFLTEESVDTPERLTKEYIFIVDPVDGTKEFVSRNGEFATNIALCHNHQIVAGVINLPVLGVTYYAYAGAGSYRIDKDGTVTRLHVNDKTEGLTVLTSRSFLMEKEVELIKKHSDKIASQKVFGAAMKFCKIAEGVAELSYRCSSYTKEWDVAAGQIILEEAGGLMLKPDGTKYPYNREDPYNREGYVLINRIENFLL